MHAQVLVVRRHKSSEKKNVDTKTKCGFAPPKILKFELNA